MALCLPWFGIFLASENIDYSILWKSVFLLLHIAATDTNYVYSCNCHRKVFTFQVCLVDISKNGEQVASELNKKFPSNQIVDFYQCDVTSYSLFKGKPVFL